MPPELERFSASQLDRLEYIEFRLRFLGEVSRADLVREFSIGTAAATRDLSIYKQLAPRNSQFRNKTKTYITGPHFDPLFKPVLTRVIAALSRGYSGSVSKPEEPILPCEYPPDLSPPWMHTLAAVSRAINQKKSGRMKYCSVSSGSSRREIVPHTLVDNGSRWHVRAFDRKSQEFRDFVLTRIDSFEIIDNDAPVKTEQANCDIEWMRVVELVLVPHPNYSHSEIVERDFRMQDGKLRVRIRAAQAGYLLRRWNVDCSPDHRLTGLEYQLWLEDPLTLYGVKNLRIAPGYQFPSDSKDRGDK